MREWVQVTAWKRHLLQHQRLLWITFCFTREWRGFSWKRKCDHPCVCVCVCDNWLVCWRYEYSICHYALSKKNGIKTGFSTETEENIWKTKTNRKDLFKVDLKGYCCFFLFFNSIQFRAPRALRTWPPAGSGLLPQTWRVIVTLYEGLYLQ